AGGLAVATSLARTAGATAAMALALAGVAAWVPSSGSGGAALTVGVGAVAGVTVYGVAAKALGARELGGLTTLRRSR
ncbi:MAG: hypothetical protein ACRD0F_07955, partial [Acidimicrobiales bacterium]